MVLPTGSALAGGDTVSPKWVSAGRSTSSGEQSPPLDRQAHVLEGETGALDRPARIRTASRAHRRWTASSNSRGWIGRPPPDVRKVVGAGIRALEPAGGLAPVCRRRLPNPEQEGGDVLGTLARGRARPAAIEIRSNGCMQLITGKQLHFLNSGYSSQDRHRRGARELLIEIYAADGQTRGVANGE